LVGGGVGGLGLSQRLRDRMASDWRSGAVELDVSVTMYREGSYIGMDNIIKQISDAFSIHVCHCYAS
jgi:hypothetical protein